MRSEIESGFSAPEADSPEIVPADFSGSESGFSVPETDFPSSKDGFSVPGADYPEIVPGMPSEIESGFSAPEADFPLSQDGFSAPEADFPLSQDGFSATEAVFPRALSTSSSSRVLTTPQENQEQEQQTTRARTKAARAGRMTLKSALAKYRATLPEAGADSAPSQAVSGSPPAPSQPPGDPAMPPDFGWRRALLLRAGVREPKASQLARLPQAKPAFVRAPQRRTARSRLLRTRNSITMTACEPGSQSTAGASCAAPRIRTAWVSAGGWRTMAV
jgi:hypothetical protein